jgi:hypothetical protein
MKLVYFLNYLAFSILSVPDEGFYLAFSILSVPDEFQAIIVGEHFEARGIFVCARVHVVQNYFIFPCIIL